MVSQTPQCAVFILKNHWPKWLTEDLKLKITGPREDI